MVGERISEALKNRIILCLLYLGMSQRETATETGASLETVNKYWQEFVEEALQGGLDNVLESNHMLDALDLSNTARLMRRSNITPADCNRALPLVGICGRLNLDPRLIPDLIESAVRFGQPGFPAAEYATVIARIHRREKLTGLTVEQVDTTHQAATDEVKRLQAETSRLQNTINSQQSTLNNQQNTLTNLRNESSTLTEELQGKQRRVDELDARIAKEGTTLLELKTYSDDKPYFVNLGLDIRNAHTVGLVFSCFAGLGYDPLLIINTITKVGNLQTAGENLSRIIIDKQKELQDVNAAKETAQKEIQNLQEKKKDEEKRVEQARQDADSKITVIHQDLDKKMEAADVTDKSLTEHVADREKLRKWGIEL